MSSGGPLFLAAGLALVASACTDPSNVAPYEHSTPAALSVAVATEPAARDDGTVPRNARFIVQLDGYPDPDSVGFGPITLRSGRGSFDLTTEVDLVGRAVIVTPRSLMAPGAQYDLVVSGLVTLDDRVQGADVIATVQVGLDDGAPFPAPPAPTWYIRDAMTGDAVCKSPGVCGLVDGLDLDARGRAALVAHASAPTRTTIFPRCAFSRIIWCGSEHCSNGNVRESTGRILRSAISWLARKAW